MAEPIAETPATIAVLPFFASGRFPKPDLLGLQDAHERLGAAVTPLLAATTRTSRHLLAAAVAGRYTEGLIGLAGALASASAPAVREALGVLRRWGASSGLDQATGLAAAIRAGTLVGAGAR